MFIVSRKDKKILRDVAKKQLEMANDPKMVDLKKQWMLHNACKLDHPLVTVEWGTFQKEVIPPLLKCESAAARGIESSLYGNFVGRMLFNDDSTVEDFFPLTHLKWITPFSMAVKVEHASDDGLGHHFVDKISNLDDDFHKLKKSIYGAAKTPMRSYKMFLQSIFGDILPVKIVGSCLYSVPTQNIIHLMSMENMFVAMMDTPEKFKQMMDMLTNDYVSYFRMLERRGFILPTTRGERVAQGTYAYTDDLPTKATDGKKMLTKDIWGFMDSQETVGISPDMFEELIFPYYKKVSDNFGLLSYGCCEAVDPIWENCLSKLTNLRKLSISPWCNEAYMGEALKDRKTIYHRKPSPNFLGVDKVFDADGFKSHIQKTIDATKGCHVEFTQRDVYTVHNDMQKVADYVKIVRSCYR